MKPEKDQKKKGGTSRELFALSKPYAWTIIIIFVVSLIVNGLNLVVPEIVASAIDAFTKATYSSHFYLWLLLGISIVIFVVATGQSVLQTYLSEQIARDLRTKLIAKISEQHFGFINEVTPEKLLTNLTGDVDNVKNTIAQGLIQIFSSVILIIGAAVLLLTINWRLGLAVLAIIPLIAAVFYFVLIKIRKYFIQTQLVIDKLNKTINESIVAASLIRIMNAMRAEYQKFRKVSGEARDVGTAIVNLFSILIPMIGVIANASIVLILFLGGRSIVAGTFTIGGFTAFIGYISILIFPIIIIGFISNLFARAAVSYDRISLVLNTPPSRERGTIARKMEGEITFKHVSLKIANKDVLKDVSFDIPAHSRTAILGPTAAGKTQIFYLLAGLLVPTEGEIMIDKVSLNDYTRKSHSDQVGLVFQDSSLFNTTIMENINFKNIEDDANIEKAIQTAELKDFIAGLPQGMNTMVAERGMSLSGGQKQRITLARALAINPEILLLDDFTARVDKDTERRIFDNMKKNYSGITQVLITQQVSSVMDFDKIILVMEGEVLAQGTHEELLASSVEYEQIYKSQMSLS